MVPMSEEWIVRVQGKEYGPVDLDDLREWKDEGRLLRENEVRAPESQQWILAGDLPELFEDQSPTPDVPSAFVRHASVVTILAQSWRIYCRGFGQFLGLSALVIVPSVCARLSSVAMGSTSDAAADLSTALAGLFNLGMFMASLAAWPIYLAGIQILTTELLHDRACTTRALVSQAWKLWPRTAGLCLLVYGSFFLLTALAFAILLLVASGASSPFVILFALALLVFQVWMFGRVFAITLFWQQTAILEKAQVADSLRRSTILARFRGGLPRFRRPLWRGAALASIWCAFATALSIGPEWATITEYFNSLTAIQDPQAILETLRAHSPGVGALALLLSVLQAILRPLLGIAFVLLYLDTKADEQSETDS